MVDSFPAARELDVPGRPRVLQVPGHTMGEVAYYLPDRDVLFCGDALATVDFETWRGNTPQLLPPWLNVDHDRAHASLTRFESLGETVVLPEHGDPWVGYLPTLSIPNRPITRRDHIEPELFEKLLALH